MWGSVGGGGGSPPPQRNDPVGLKLRAVGLKMMRLFTCSALRSKLIFFKTRDRLRLLSIELEMCSNGSNSSEVIWRNITYLFREFIWTNYHSKHAQRNEIFIYIPNMLTCMRYLYVTITCWHFYLEFRFCKVIHRWYSILAKISNPQNQTPKCDESRKNFQSLNYIFKM
jgi:hypothetical protein